MNINYNQNNVIQNKYRNSGNLQLPSNSPNSNQPNIGALSTKYNTGIYTTKRTQKLPQKIVKDLFNYFKYLTVLRAYQINPNIIEQSSDPFIQECVQITRFSNTPYKPSSVINKLKLTQIQQNTRRKSRTSPIIYTNIPVGGKRKRS